MALNYYNNTNKVEHELLIISLKQKDHVLNKWLYSRVVTKNYSYIGLNRETAKACAEEKTAKYQYYVDNYEWTNDGDTSASGTFIPKKSLVNGANVSAKLVGGGLYEVNISVNINDECVIDSVTEPSRETILNAFQIRDFDEG